MKKKGVHKHRNGRRRMKKYPPGSLPHHRPHWAIAGAILLSSVFGGIFISAAAQTPDSSVRNTREPVRQFKIPAGPINEALQAFQAATGVRPSLVGVNSSLQSQGVIGSFTHSGALLRLLGGTGLKFRFDDPLVVAIYPGDRDEPVTLREVTVQGNTQAVSSPKYTQALREIPQTISVVTSRMFEEQGATTLREVLRNVPGITINAGEGGATPGDNFNVRGFSARGDVFVDGVRDLAGYSRESFNLQQVEVAKGPGSTFAGRGSTGGTINMVSKVPTLRPMRQVEVDLGSAAHKRSTIDVNQPLNALGISSAAFRLNALYHDADVAGVDIVTTNKWGLAPSLAIGLGSKTPFTLSYYHLDSDGIPAYGLQSQDSLPQLIDTHRFFGLTSRDHEKVNTDNVTAKVTHLFGSAVRVSNQLSWNDSNVDRIVTFANLDKTRVSRSHVTADEVTANQTNLTADFKTGGLGHTLSIGVDYSNEKSSFAQYTLSAPPSVVDLNNPDPSAPVTGTPLLHPFREAESKNLGIYAFETVRFGQKLEITGGLRFDSFDPKFFAPPGTTPAPPAPASADVTSWRAGVVYKPKPNGSVYIAYGTSFNPSLQNLAYEATSTLDPEENRSLEIGSKWDVVHERLAVTGAVFRTDKTNARTSDPNDPALGTVLEGEQRVEGIEIGATGALTREWSLYLGYTFMESEVLESRNALQVGSVLPNTPKHSFTAWTTFATPWDLELGLGGRYLDRRLVQLGRGGYAPAYLTFDATASYRVNRTLSLRLQAQNLGNTLYYDNGRFWSPAPGRAVRLATTVDF